MDDNLDYFINMMKRIFTLFFLLLGVVGSQGNKHVFTQVTCMYDIKRGDLGQFKRTFQYYLSNFDMLLQTDSNLIIFGGKNIQAYVWERRKPHNTVFVLKQIETFKEFWFYPYVQRIRQKFQQDPSFPRKDHPQYALEYYNMIMFSKTYLLTSALDYDKFNSDYFIWTDGGLNHIFSKSMVSPENHLRKLFEFFQPQWVFFTYSDPFMFQGYAQGSQRYLNGVRVKDNQSVLAGFFGGYINAVRDVRCTYENFLRIILQNGDMNSDESLVSMLPIKYPFLFPTTFGCGPEYLYQKIRVYMNFNRKPENSRLFRGTFDNDGNIHVIENGVFTKYVVRVQKQQEKSPSTETKQIPQVTKPVIQLPKVIQQKIEEKSVVTVTTQQVAFYKQIFYHQSIFLMVMIVFYIIMILKRSQEYIQVPKIFNSDRETIIYYETVSNQ